MRLKLQNKYIPSSMQLRPGPPPYRLNSHLIKCSNVQLQMFLFFREKLHFEPQIVLILFLFWTQIKQLVQSKNVLKQL